MMMFKTSMHRKKVQKGPTFRTLKGKVKKGFAAYCAIIMVMMLVLAMPMTAFAANNDPLTVVNNLSDFIFGLIRAIGPVKVFKHQNI